MPDRLLTAREVAERLNISRSYVYYLVRVGELPSIRIRRAIRVRPRALELFIAASEHQASIASPRRSGDGDPG